MIKYNNPGNIRYREQDKWQGLADSPEVNGFCNFVGPCFGVRTIARQLIANQDRHNCHTIRDHITRYAPPSENKTETYIVNVSAWTGISQSLDIDVHSYDVAYPLVRAIIRQEQGRDAVSDAVIKEGLRLAGIVPPGPSSSAAAVAKDPKVIAATIAGTLASAQAAVSSISDIWETVGKVIDPRYLVWACVAVIVTIGIGYAVQRVVAHREGRVV